MNASPVKSLRPTMRGVIDRLEGDYAIIVLDDGQRLLWAKDQLPSQAKEGVVVTLSLEINWEETSKRLSRVSGMLDELFSQGQK